MSDKSETVNNHYVYDSVLKQTLTDAHTRIEQKRWKRLTDFANAAKDRMPGCSGPFYTVGHLTAYLYQRDGTQIVIDPDIWPNVIINPPSHREAKTGEIQGNVAELDGFDMGDLDGGHTDELETQKQQEDERSEETEELELERKAKQEREREEQECEHKAQEERERVREERERKEQEERERERKALCKEEEPNPSVSRKRAFQLDSDQETHRYLYQLKRQGGIEQIGPGMDGRMITFTFAHEDSIEEIH